MCINTYIHTYIHKLYIYTDRHTHTHTHTHTHIHTQDYDTYGYWLLVQQRVQVVVQLINAGMPNLNPKH